MKRDEYLRKLDEIVNNREPKKVRKKISSFEMYCYTRTPVEEFIKKITDIEYDGLENVDVIVDAEDYRDSGAVVFSVWCDRLETEEEINKRITQEQSRLTAEFKSKQELYKKLKEELGE